MPMNYEYRLFDFLDENLKKFPKDDLLCSKVDGQWVPLGTKDVVNKVQMLATGLLKAGYSGHDLKVENMDKIAILSKNRPEWLMLDLACQQTGACLCPIYPTTNINELEFIFNDASIKAVFVGDKDMLNKVEDVRHKTPSLKAIYSFDILEGSTHWEDLWKYVTKEDVHRLINIKATILPEHCATIIYTSGTTGFPKGVMLSHRNIASNVINALDSFPFEDDADKRALSFLPLNHIFERLITYIYLKCGTSIYYAESLETIGDNLKEVKPHIFTTVPRLLEKVYDKIMATGSALTGVKRKLFFWAIDLAKEYDNRVPKGFAYNMQLQAANKIIFSKWREALGGNIKYIITGGAACQERLLRIFNAAQIPVYEGYGPTENSPVITVNRKQAGGTKFGTVGPPLNGQEVRLNADGEICVKGPSVMMGYYKKPDLTAETVIDGWLHTGDIGVWEDGKFIRITDRKKELFKTSGGKYVAPQPIENRMKESPFIEQMMVVGAEKKFVGALIVPSETNLREWMRENNVEFTSMQEAVKNPKVHEFYQELVDVSNKFFNNVEQVKKFELLPEEWTIDTGELTPTLKLKRKVIMEKYKDVIERIYD